MSGFKNFLLRGNLIEMAVGVIIAVSFNSVVQTFTNWLTALMPKGVESVFSNKANSFGAFLNAVVSFVILAAVVYFFVVLPYTKAREKFFPTEADDAPTDVDLLAEIRDLIKARNA